MFISNLRVVAKRLSRVLGACAGERESCSTIISSKKKKMIVVQLSYKSNIFFFFSVFFFFNDQPLDLFFYIWALNIQWLILKKVVRFVQKLYEICARNITKKEKNKKKKRN
jgi:hypothetical protein